MKSIKLLLALCALTALSKAQPITGQSYYNNGGMPAFLSSGTYVSTNPGFIMARYQPSGVPNFVVDKVDVDGTFSGATGIFGNTYKTLTGGVNCNSTLSQE